MGALSPGQLLEGTSYQVVREIGAGGMGVVYEIEHVRLKKRYVAKVIHDQIRHDEGAAKRMEREAQVLAAISHPNIVQVHDVGTTPDGVSYFVMEKLEGVDLRQTMKRHGVRRVRSLEIVADVLEALAYVHARGMVHRDIKPENIFLAEQPHGTVTKVLDFGIVHIFDSDGRVSQGRITKTGGFVGTLYYAAPEQMQGKAAGPPNDVYAAGLVLFELLAGKGPFDDDPGVGLSRCFKAAPLLTELVPTAPRELDEVVARALEMDPARRPTASELAAELRKVGAALKAAPGAVEDEAIRAEVDDLLRHMAPIDHGPPRPAAGRLPTPDPALGPNPNIAVGATAVPPTPVMARAPGRVPSDDRAAFEATLASPTGEPGASGPAAPRPAAGQPATGHMQAAGVPSNAQPVQPTMPGAGVAPQPVSPSPHPGAHATGPGAPAAGIIPAPAGTGAQPGIPPGAPQRLSSSPALPQGAGFPSGGHAQAAAMPPPGFPTGAPHPGPTNQLFASTLPVRPATNDSVPGAPAVTGETSTSPGVYATVDNQSVPSTRLPVRTPWGVLVAAGGAVLLALVLIGGAVVMRKRGTADDGASSSTTTASSTSAPSSIASSSSTGVSAPATDPSTASSVATPSAPASAPAGASSAPPATTTAPITTATANAKGGGPSITRHGAPPPAPPPPAHSTTASTATSSAKAAAPAAPRGSSSAHVDKDGYVKTF